MEICLVLAFEGRQMESGALPWSCPIDEKLPWVGEMVKGDESVVISSTWNGGDGG